MFLSVPVPVNILHQSLAVPANASVLDTNSLSIYNSFYSCTWGSFWPSYDTLYGEKTTLVQMFARQNRSVATQAPVT